jgi:hypothetical protein
MKKFAEAGFLSSPSALINTDLATVLTFYCLAALQEFLGM